MELKKCARWREDGRYKVSLVVDSVDSQLEPARDRTFYGGLAYDF